MWDDLMHRYDHPEEIMVDLGPMKPICRCAQQGYVCNCATVRTPQKLTRRYPKKKKR